MFRRQFWLRFGFNSFWNHQLLNILLLGIAIFSFAVVWASSIGSIGSLPRSYEEANPALTNEYVQESVTPQIDKQDSSKEGSEASGFREFRGKIIAALEGYDVSIHGFGFENYGDEQDYVQLTSMEVERLFGQRACANKVNGECILTPLAKQWMIQKNKSMGRGHCDGMAALSLLFYRNQLKVEDFGGSSVSSLQLEGNEKLQREIAYWWTTQATEPTRSAREKNALTPSEVVKELFKAFIAGRNSEVYTIALWKPNRRGGHAVTPFAIEDRGNGIFAILVYDNNYPNTTRKILVDSNTDTWKYNTSINPNEPEYEFQGDATTKTLLLTPTSFRLQLQKCPFCEENIAPLAGEAEEVDRNKQVMSYEL